MRHLANFAAAVCVAATIIVGNTSVSQAKSDAYIVTSRMSGVFPKIGPVKHVSIAICPEGVSPIVYENGVAVSNVARCRLYGTQVLDRGFKLEEKRLGVSAFKISNMSAETVIARMQNHHRLNIPLISDCRHHVMQVVGKNRGKRLIGRLLVPLL